MRRFHGMNLGLAIDKLMQIFRGFGRGNNICSRLDSDNNVDGNKGKNLEVYEEKR